MADRVLAAVRKLFNWVATRDDDFRSPIVKGMSRRKPSERKRSLDDDEIKEVWAACDATKPPIYGLLVRFLLLTGQRREEVAAARWKEISGDTWIIPAERYKMKIPNVVPLSKAAQAVVAGLPRIGAYVSPRWTIDRFPGSRNASSGWMRSLASKVGGFTICGARRRR